MKLNSVRGGKRTGDGDGEGKERERISARAPPPPAHLSRALQRSPNTFSGRKAESQPGLDGSNATHRSRDGRKRERGKETGRRSLICRQMGKVAKKSSSPSCAGATSSSPAISGGDGGGGKEARGGRELSFCSPPPPSPPFSVGWKRGGKRLRLVYLRERGTLRTQRKKREPMGDGEGEARARRGDLADGLLPPFYAWCASLECWQHRVERNERGG